MRLSLLLCILAAFLVSFGVCGGALVRAGLNRGKAAFFLFCIAVTDAFTLHPSEQLYISPACIIFVLWMYFAAYSKAEPAVAAALPAGLLLGVFLLPLAALDTEWTPFLVGAVSALPAFLFGALTAASAAALAPLCAHTAAFAYGVLTNGYSSLELAESALSAQLFALICTFIIRSSISKQKPADILKRAAS